MAIQTISVTFTSASSATFTFPTPNANYGKTAGITITAPTPVIPVTMCFLADSASAGTTTGTIQLSDTITGTAEVCIYDRP